MKLSNLNKKALLGCAQASAVGLVIFGLLSACGSNPTTFLPNNTDHFSNHSSDQYRQASQILAGDYVFIIDPSYSTINMASTIRSSLNNLTQDLVNSGIDYRLALINGNYQGNQDISTLSTGFWGGTFLSKGSDLSQLDSVFNQIAQPNQPNREVPIAAALKTLRGQASSFVRSGAQLVLIFASDASDESISNGMTSINDSTITSLANQFYSIKPSAYISARSIGTYSGCDSSEGTTRNTNNVNLLAQRLNVGDSSFGTVVNCIQNEVSSTISNLARDVSRPANRFQLFGSPITSTIQVYEGAYAGGTAVNLVSTGRYHYEPASNEIVFNVGQEPNSSFSLKIKYQIRFILSNTPQANTIQVSVNGSALDSSKFSYVSSSNEVTFTGGYYPPEDSSVDISYVLQ